MSAQILQGDVAELLKTFPQNSFDGCLCDPPYGLSEKRNMRSASPRRSSREARRSGGFMGMLWDADVPGLSVWAQAFSVLKPGAYLLAFGGTRTYHRLVSNIEDAGFEISDTICWLYGQGFPKGNLGAGRGARLKPAWEPITVALKPCDGTFAENAAKWGTFGMSIDNCRVPIGDGQYARNCSGDRGHSENRTRKMNFQMGGGHANDAGRWPANVLLDEEAAEQLDEQSGILTSGANPARRKSDKFRNTYSAYRGQDCTPIRGADKGGASRFFYCAKASAAERGEGNTHPTVKPLSLCEYLARLILPPARETPRRLLVPFSGSGSEILAALSVGWEEVLGVEIEPAYIQIARNRLNQHFPLFAQSDAQ